MYESTKNKRIYKPDLIYPDLSYQIIGILFDVFLNLGYGYKENQYHKGVEVGFTNAGIDYKKELPVKITYKNRFITTIYLDFLIKEKVILEIKQGDRFNKKDIEQVFNYLKATDLKLGILARFTRSGVKFKRIVNIEQ